MSGRVPDRLGTSVRVVGRAKINLFLSVDGLRVDGYHDLEMVMQTVELADELAMTWAPRSSRDPRGSSGTQVAFRWADGLRREDHPARPDLVERAVERYLHRAREVVGSSAQRPAAGLPIAGEPAAIDVQVLKRIPLASGMAGGSADAAAALLGMDALSGGLLTTELPEMAAALGSDVPFALAGGTCLARGRGELLEPVASPAELWWVLGISAFGVATPPVFRRHDELQTGTPRGPGEPASGRPGPGSVEAATPRGPAAGPEPGGQALLCDLVAALGAGDAVAVASCLRNELAPAARGVEPRLGPLEAAMRKAGALGAVVSGSGPTVVGLCRDRTHAREVAARAAPAFGRVEVVSSARRGAEVVAPGPH